MRIGLVLIYARRLVLEPFDLPFMQRALVELLVLAVVAGTLGTWIVLRGLAFTTHGVAAATFPALVLADGLAFSATAAACGAGVLFALGVGRLAATARTGHDHLTALVLVAALALGAVLASDVFASGAQVESLLFGSLLAVGAGEVRFAVAIATLALVANALLGRRWLAVGFDPGAAHGLGVRSSAADVALLVLIALAAVAALSAVGALLATALLVVPAATTRMLTSRLRSWQLATVALAAAEGTGGLWLAFELNAPPGATIAVFAGGAFALVALARAAGEALLRARGRARAAGAGEVAA